MRRTALIGGLLLLAVAAGTLGAVVWVDRALAAVQAGAPGPLCLSVRDRQKITKGTFPREQRDIFVAKAINSDQGEPGKISWWHLRGATIQAVYIAFWSRGQRDSEFKTLASKSRDCPTKH